MTTPVDEFWLQPVTALQQAYYDQSLRLASSMAEQRAAEVTARNRRIFGECLLALAGLGLPETKARTMLGKWRSALKDDEALIRLVLGTAKANVPDPISYITAAIKKSQTKATAAETVQTASWTLLGWEAPRVTTRGHSWRGEARGQVWRDPFGKITILPAPADTTIPSIDEDPGIDLSNA